jgi:hypothetical protein
VKRTGPIARTGPRSLPSQNTNLRLKQGESTDGVGRCVTVEKNGCRLISIVEGMRFATRQEATLYVKNFAIAQGKQAVTDRKLSEGHGNVYVCSSRTPCTFIVTRLVKVFTVQCTVAARAEEQSELATLNAVPYLDRTQGAWYLVNPFRRRLSSGSLDRPPMSC